MSYIRITKGAQMANEKRDDRLFMRVTPEEKEVIKSKAKAMGLRVSTYLRLLLLRGKVKG